jgi:hypothetical protein
MRLSKEKKTIDLFQKCVPHHQIDRFSVGEAKSMLVSLLIRYFSLNNTHRKKVKFTFSPSSFQFFSQCQSSFQPVKSQSSFQPVKFSGRFQILTIDAILIFIGLFSSSRYLVEFYLFIYLFIYLSIQELNNRFQPM